MKILLITEGQNNDVLLNELGKTAEFNIKTDKNEIFRLLSEVPSCPLVVFKIKEQLIESYHLAKQIGKDHGSKIGKIILCFETNEERSQVRVLNTISKSREDLYFETHNERLFDDTQDILEKIN